MIKTPDATSPKPLLEVHNLQTHFQSLENQVKAVDGITFSVNKGETVGIVGESGSGKSVTSLSVMGLLPSQAQIMGGDIWFNSWRYGRHNLAQASEAQLRSLRGEEMAMIFQEPMTSLNPVYTCGSQVAEALRVNGRLNRVQAREKTLELFKRVHLPRPEKLYHAYPHEISGGQKQRVMIAMAMSCEPQLLIADEPTTALDVTVQASILDLMRELRDENDMAIMFITHDLGVVAEIADRVLVMYQGKIVEQGTVWEIFANPKHPYTQGLLACRPRLNMQMKYLPTVGDFLTPQGTEEPKKPKYHSVGEALLYNAVPENELLKRRKAIMAKLPLLEVHNLKTHFPLRKGLFGKPTETIKAVDDVSLTVYPGEVLGIVGESGCGKTTLGRTILGLEQATSGEVVYNGQPLRQLKASELRALRKDLQIVFQDPYASLNPRMTVGEAILEPMRVHRVGNSEFDRQRRALELLETVGLPASSFQRYPHEFSGGQRQRISIARALALEPRFLVCDESVSALDVSVQAQVLNLLIRLKNEFNLTYIFISHDLSVVKFMADRILVMKDGKIVEEGFPEVLYSRPRQEYTERLIYAIPKGDLEDIRRAQIKRKISQEKPYGKKDEESTKGATP